MKGPGFVSALLPDADLEEVLEIGSSLGNLLCWGNCVNARFPAAFMGAVNGKGDPVESRPIVKSEFRQIPPNRLQLSDRVPLTRSFWLSIIAHSTVLGEDARSRHQGFSGWNSIRCS